MINLLPFSDSIILWTYTDPLTASCSRIQSTIDNRLRVQLAIQLQVKQLLCFSSKKLIHCATYYYVNTTATTKTTKGLLTILSSTESERHDVGYEDFFSLASALAVLTRVIIFSTSSTRMTGALHAHTIAHSETVSGVTANIFANTGMYKMTA